MTFRRPLAVFILAAVLLVPVAQAGQIDSANLLITGAGLEVPASVDTGADIPAVIQTTFGKKMNDDVPETGMSAVGELSGPGLDAPVTVTTRPGGKFVLPPLHEQADYTLSNIRLVDSQGKFVQYATPTATVIHVVGTLGTSVKITQLTPEDLRARGITVDSRNYDVYDYSFTFAVNGVNVVVPYQVIIDRRTHEVVTAPDATKFKLPEPSPSGPPPRFQPPPSFPLTLREDLSGDGGPDPGGGPFERNVDHRHPSIPAAVIIPTGFGVLHQFFAVILNVSNNAPAGSEIALDEVTATIATPTGLRVVKINPPVTIGQAVPIRDANGATLLVATAQGSADWSLEALRSGSHAVDIDIHATYKAPNQADVLLHGHTTSTIVVSDPRFQINFVSPQNVRKDVPYTAYAFITNTSPQAQTVKIDVSSLPACGNGFNLHLCRTEGGSGVSDLTFQPGQTIPVPYKLTPDLTGHFYAAAGDAPDGITTTISLVLQVQPGDIPLSPATLVLPFYTQFVSSALVDANMPLLGIGYSLATAPLTAEIAKFPRLIQNDVYLQAQAIARAGERIFVSRHAPETDDAVEDRDPIFHLALDLLGNVERLDRASVSSDLREWDQLRMLHPAGRSAGAAMARELERAGLTGGKSIKTFVDDFAAATSHRTPYFVAVAHGASVNGADRAYAMTVTGVTSHTAMTGVAESPDTAARNLAYGELTRFNSSTESGEMAIVGRWNESIELSIVPAASTFSLDLIYPGTNDGTVIRNSLNVSGATPGTPVKIVIDRGNHALNVTGGVIAPIVNDVVPAPLTLDGAAQDLHLDDAGHIVTLLFNRPVAVADQATLRDLFQLTTTIPGEVSVIRKNKPNDSTAPIVIPGAAIQDDGRMINISFDHALSTHATYLLAIDPIADPLVPGQSYTSASIVPRIDNDKPGGVVIGKLLLGDGSGVPNALVQVLANDSMQYDTTMPDGSFLFEFIPRDIDNRILGNYSLDTVVDAKEAKLDGVIRTNGEVQHVVLQFLGRGTATGHCSYSDGTAVTDAPVTIGSQVYDEFHRTSTDANGDYTITDLPVGTLTFAVQDSKGNVAYATDQIRTPGQVLTQDLVIKKRELAGLGTVRVTVKRSDSGLAVPGAHVGVYTQGYSLIDGFADVNGQFEFDKVPAGLVSVLAADYSFAPESAGVEFDLNRDSVVEQTLVLHVPTTDDQAGYATVEGDVKRDDPTDPSNPTKEVLVPNAVVQIAGMATVTANASGHYVAPNVPVLKAGKKINAFDPATGRSGTFFLPGELHPGVSNNVPLTFRTTTPQGIAKLRVKLTAASGEQVRSYQVIIPGYPPDRFTLQSDGTYWLEDVKVPYAREVWAIPVGRDPVYGDQTAHGSIRADFDGQDPLIELRLPGQGTVNARILTLKRCPDTNPTCPPTYDTGTGKVVVGYRMWDDIEQELIFKERPPVETDPVTELAQTTKIPVGEGISVETIDHPDGYASATTLMAFEGDVKTVDLKLEAMGSVTGRVVNYDGQTPVEGATITFEGSTENLETVTKADGSFVIPSVAGAQTFRITAEATVDGIYRKGYVDGGTPHGGGPVGGLVIVMRQQANITGSIVDSTGAPISKARYWVRELAWPYRPFGSPQEPLLAGTDGRFFVNNVFAGGVRITAESPTVQEERGDAQVEIKQELDDKNDVVITVASGAGTSSLTVSVVDSNNAYAKVPNAEVTLINSRGAYDFASTDANGVVVFEQLPAGQTYGLRATSKAVGRSGSVDGIALTRDVPASAQVALTLTGRVAGSVFDGDTDPEVVVKGVPVYLYTGTFNTRVTTDSTGAFVFNGIPEGNFTLEAVDIDSGRKGSNSGLFIDKLFPDRDNIHISLEKTATLNVGVYLPDDHNESSGLFAPLVDIKVLQGLYSREQQAAGQQVSFPKLRVGPEAEIIVQELGGEERSFRTSVQILAATTTVPIVLSTTGTLKVQITADDPTLVPNAFVQINGPRGTSYYADSTGLAQIDNLPLGNYSVYVYSQNLSAAASGQLLSHSSPLTLTLKLGSRASIHGYVDAEFGGVSANTRVIAVISSTAAPGGIRLETRTDAAGHYIFNGVPVASTHIALTFVGPDDVTIGALLPNVTIADGTLGSVEMDRVKLDATPPAVVSLFPANNANSVAPNAQLLITFSEQLADSSISSSTFKLVAADDASVVSTTLLQKFVNGKPVVVITPAAQLRSNTIYRYTIEADGVLDTTGNRMKANVAASFTTVDYTEPRATGISPSTAIPIDKGVTFRLKFNKPVDISSFTAPNTGVAKLEQLAAPGGNVIANLPVAVNLDTVDPSTILLSPNGVQIASSSFYRITISGTKDTQTPPNVQTAAQVFEYSSVDTVRPVVSIVSPVAAGVQLIAGASYPIKVSIVDEGTGTVSKDIQYVDWFTTDGTTDTAVARVRVGPDYTYLLLVPKNVTTVTLKASAADLSFNSSDVVSFTWDTTPNQPPQNVTLTTSAPSAYLTGHVDANVTFADEGTVAQVNLSVTGQHADGSDYVLPDGAFTPSPHQTVGRADANALWAPSPAVFGIDLPSDLKEGTSLHFAARVTDSDNQSTTKNVDVSLLADDVPPVIVSMTPQSETSYKFVSGAANTFPIVVKVKDGESGVARVSLSYDTHTINSIATKSYDALTGIWTFTATGEIVAKNADTRIHITATAYDYHGNATPASVDVIYLSVNDGTIPVAQWLTPLDGAALPASTAVSLKLRVHAIDNIKVEKVDFTSSAFATQTLTAPTQSGDIYEQVVSFTTPAAGTPFTVTATISDSDPQHDVVLPLSIDPVALDTSAGDAMLTGDASIEAADAAHYSGHTIVVSGSGTDVYFKVPLTLKNLIVINGGHVGDPDRVKLDLTIKDHLFVDADSSVDMSSKGFLGGRHTSEDASLTNSSERGMTIGDTTIGHGAIDASASYGGAGGESLGGVTNTTYGSIQTPIDFGSGGSGQPNGSQAGGNGGGAIALHGSTAAGDLSTFVIAGAVRSDGETGTGSRWGAGSGGSVLLSSRTLITGPSSRITANGGDDDGADNNATGAGGGRMSVAAADRLDVTDLTKLLQVRGGRNLGPETRTTLDGGAGTLFLQRPGFTLGELLVSSFDERFPATVHLTRYTPVGSANGVLTFDAITVLARALSRFDDAYTVADASKITHDADSLIVLPEDVPSVSMSTTPAAGADVIQGASIAATLNGSSVAGIGRIALAFSAGTPAPVYFYDYANAIPATNAPVPVAVTASTGNATLKAIVTDRAGRTAETPVSTFNVIANAAPVITSFDVTPSSLQLYAGHTITVDAAASDDIAVTSLSLSTTGGLTVTPQNLVNNGNATTRSFSISIPVTTAGGTNIDLTLSASDSFPSRAATTQTKSVAVLADTNPPAISITSPAAGATFDVSSTNTISIRAVVVDAEAGVSQVWATIGNGAQIPMVPDPSVPNGWKADPTVPSVDGTQTVPEDVVVFARDYSNNTGSSAPQTINIHPVFDPNGASVSWTCPSAGALFPSGFTTKLRVVATPATTDNGVTSVVFYIGDATTPVAASAIGNNIYEATVQLPAGGDGTPLPLRVVATTIRNNVTDVRVTATIITGSTINATTSILDGDTQYDGKTVIVTGGTTTIAGAHTFTRLAVLDGAAVTHAVVDSTSAQRLDLQVTGAVYVSCGGSISTTGKGYQDAVNGFGRTWPNTTTGGSFQGSAGSHGGEGGHGSEASAAAYGSILDPNEPGGAGGHSGNYTGNQGGGIVRIRGAASITVDGTIAADGLYAGQNASGAGAGGSIRLDAAAIGGTGSIHANGASGTTANFGGGGGRIALYYQSLALPRANLSASGGDASTNFGGGAGTIYLSQLNASGAKVADELRAVNSVAKSAGITPLPALTTGTVTTVSGTTAGLSGSVPEFIAGSQIDFLDATGQIIETALIASRSASSTGVVLQNAPSAGVIAGTAYRGVWSFDQITVLGSELLQASTVRPALVTTDSNGLLRAAEIRGGDFKLRGHVETALVDVTNATLENSAFLTHAPNTTATVSRLVINAGTINVDATSRIDVSGKGYQDQSGGYGRTWPFTFTGGAYQGSAGSHGGEGGHGSEPFAAAYGSAFDPNEPGGAGGHPGNYAGNEGGGIIRIKTQTLNLDGSILANGLYASQSSSGSGAGGAIRIDADSLTGSGLIKANGADAAPSNFGGGGGRVAIYAASMALPRTNVTAIGGTSSGAPGTVLFRTGSQLYGDLVVDNGGRTTTAKTTLTSLGFNRVTSSTATSVRSSVAHFDAPNSLTGINLILRGDLTRSWPVVGNDSTTVTVTADSAFTPQPGDIFRGLYRLDTLRIRDAIVETQDLVQLTAASVDSDATASYIFGNNAPPSIDTAKISIINGPAVKGVLNAITDTDGPIVITLTNQHSHEQWTSTIASGAPFTIGVSGQSGDALTIRAKDSHRFPLESADVAVGTLTMPPPAMTNLDLGMLSGDAGFRARLLSFDGATLAVAGNSQSVAILSAATVASPSVSRRVVIGDGVINDIVIANNTLFVAANNLSTLSLADVNSTRVIGPALGSTELAVAVDGGMAFTTADGGEGRLQIYDVTDPASPRMLKNVALMGGVTFRDVLLYGRYLLLLTPEAGHGVVIVDRTNIDSLSIVADLEVPNFHARRGIVNGSKLYLTGSSGETVTVDLTNPRAPAVVSRIALTSPGIGLAANASDLYVAGQNSGLVDVTLGAAPAVSAAYAVGGVAWDVSLAPPYAYVAAEDSLAIIALNLPPQVNAGRISIGALASGNVPVTGLAGAVNGVAPLTVTVTNARSGVTLTGVTVDGSGAFTASLAASPGDAITVAATDGSNRTTDPVTVGSVALATTVVSVPIPQTGNVFARTLAKAGNILVVAGSANDQDADTLAIFDVSDPTAPQFQRTVSGGNSVIYDVKIASNDAYGTYAYVASYDLCTIDLLNVDSQKNCVAADGGELAVAPAGNYLFAARNGQAGNIRVYDVSKPYVPRLLKEFSTVNGIDYRDLLTYGSDYLIGLSPYSPHDVVVIDRRDINNLVKVAELEIPGLDAFRGKIIGSTLYVSGSGSGMAIVDLTNPLSPRIESVSPTTGTHGVAVAGSTVVTADGAAGVTFLDATNPASPQAGTQQPVGGNAWDVLLAGNVLYVANEIGLVVVKDLAIPPTFDSSLVELFANDSTHAFVFASANAVAGQGPLTVDLKNTHTGLVTSLTPDPDGGFFATPSGSAGEAFTLKITDGVGRTAGPFDIGSVPFTAYGQQEAPTSPVPARTLATDDGSLIVVAGWANDQGVGGDSLAIFTPFDPNGNGQISPQLQRTVSAGSSVIYDVKVSNGWAYVASYDFCTINLLDVNSQKNCVSADGGELAVAPAGKYVFASKNGLAGNIRVYDVTNPAAPALFTESSTLSGVDYYDLLTYGNDYLIGISPYSPHDVVVIDRRDLNHLVKVAEVDVPGFSGFRGKIVGSTLYVSGNGAGMAIIDLTNPLAPQVKSMTDDGAFRHGVTATGTTVVTADGARGVTFFDATNPASPVKIGTQPVSGVAWDALLFGDVLYVANENGLVTLQHVSAPPIIQPSLISIYADGTHAQVSGVTFSVVGTPTLRVDVTNTTSGAIADPVDADMYGFFVVNIPAVKGDQLAAKVTDGAGRVAGPVFIGIVGPPPPTVDATKITFTFDGTNAHVIGAPGAIIDGVPPVRVTFWDGSYGSTGEFPVGSDGSFAAVFNAYPGDFLTVSASDRSGSYNDVPIGQVPKPSIDTSKVAIIYSGGVPALRFSSGFATTGFFPIQLTVFFGDLQQTRTIQSEADEAFTMILTGAHAGYFVGLKIEDATHFVVQQGLDSIPLPPVNIDVSLVRAGLGYAKGAPGAVTGTPPIQFQIAVGANTTQVTLAEDGSFSAIVPGRDGDVVSATATDFFGTVTVPLPAYSNVLAIPITPAMTNGSAFRAGALALDSDTLVVGPLAGSAAHDKFLLFDISDPTVPLFKRSISADVGGTLYDVSDVAADNGWAYAVAGRYLLSTSLTDPAGAVNTADITDSRSIAVKGDDLYSLGSDGVVRRWNVSNEASPVPAGQYTLAHPYTSILLHGTRYLVAISTSPAEIAIVDTTLSSGSAVIGTLSLPAAPAHGRISGSTLFLTANSGGEYAVDLGAPAAPHLLNTTSAAPAGSAASNAIDLAGNTAFVAAGASGVQLYDVSDPAAPRSIALPAQVGSASFDVRTSNGWAYVADDTQLLVCAAGEFPPTIDPSLVSMLGSTDAGGGLVSFALTGAPGAVHALLSSVLVFENGDTAPISADGSFIAPHSASPGSTFKIQVRDSAGRLSPAVTIGPVQSSASTVPITAAMTDASFRARQVAVIGDTLVVASRIDAAGNYASDKLALFDITNPTSPVYKDTLALGHGAISSILPTGGYLYVACDKTVAQVNFKTNPPTVTFIFTSENTLPYGALGMIGSQLFLLGNDASGTPGLLVYEAADPANVQFTSLIPAPSLGAGPARMVPLGNRSLLISTNDRSPNGASLTSLDAEGSGGGTSASYPIDGIGVSGDRIFVTNPVDRQFIEFVEPGGTSTPTAGAAHTIDIVGNLAIVADDVAGVSLFDISVRNVPRRIGTFSVIGTAWDVKATHNVIYVAADTGLAIVTRAPLAPVVDASAITVTTDGAATATVTGGVNSISGQPSLTVDLTTDTGTTYGAVVSYNGSFGPAALSGKPGDTLTATAVDGAGRRTPAPLGAIPFANTVETFTLAPGVTTDSAAVMHRFSLDGTKLYASGGFRPAGQGESPQIFVFDTTRPINAQTPAVLDAGPDVVVSFVARGGWVYAMGINSLTTVEAATGTKHTVPGPVPASMRAIAVSGNQAFVAARHLDGDQQFVIQIYDVTNPANPQFVRELPQFDSGAFIDGLQPVGLNHLAVFQDFSNVGGKVYILDKSNIDNVHVVSTVAIGGLYDGTVIGNTLYAISSGYNIGLMAIDLSDVLNPIVIGQFPIAGQSLGVAASGPGEIAVANGSLGVTFVDVTNPSAPVIKGTQSVPGIAFDVLAIGKTVYVAADRVIDAMKRP